MSKQIKKKGNVFINTRISHMYNNTYLFLDDDIINNIEAMYVHKKDLETLNMFQIAYFCCALTKMLF